jgi:hypothetical protein
MVKVRNNPMARLLDARGVIPWIRGGLNFLDRPEDSFKNKTASKKERYKRENDWAWELFNTAAPSNKYKQDGKWSGAFGQLILQEIIPGGWKPRTRKGRQLDWEDENFVYEFKTQFHLSGGTAQEKIPAVPIKYIEVPELFGKPLRVICLAGAETYTRVFLRDCPKMRDQLALWKSWNIEFVYGTDLIKGLDPK